MRSISYLRAAMTWFYGWSGGALGELRAGLFSKTAVKSVLSLDNRVAAGAAAVKLE
jgi:hypothetical protein